MRNVDAESGRVRPYVHTHGRAKPAFELPVEALVVTAQQAPTPAHLASHEYRQIRELCRSTHSVAEVAAHLRLPLGVARILISDLSEAGVVAVHTIQERPNSELLDRVLQGLRRA